MTRNASNRRICRPFCEQLEARIALSALSVYPVGFMGPIPAGATMAAAAAPAPAMTFGPRVPNLGSRFSVTVTVPIAPGTAVKSCVFDYTIEYDDFTSNAIVSSGGNGLSTQIAASVPGQYEVQAVVTFQRTAPGAIVPADIVLEESVDVPVPTTVTKATGLNTPAYEDADIMVTDTVSSSLGQIGTYVSVTIQEAIPFYLVYPGDESIKGTNGWYPPSGVTSAQFYLAAGTLHDAIGGVPSLANWADVPIGGEVATYWQDLQYVWRMTGTDEDGVGSNELFDVELTTLSWTITKVSADTFSVS